MLIARLSSSPIEPKTSCKPIEAALGGETVGLKKNRPQDALRGLQESFKRLHKTEADHASVASLLEKTRSRVPSLQQA